MDPDQDNDVTEVEQLRERLARVERRFTAMIEQSQDFLDVYDGSLRHLYQSPGSLRLWGPLDADARTNVLDRLGPAADEARELLEQVIATPGASMTHDFPARFQGDRAGWVRLRATNLLDDPDVGGVVVSGQEVTAEVDLADELRHAATHDLLTGLPNRLLLLNHLDGLLDQGAGDKAVLFVDLDRFKFVNESYGHAAGDQVLRELAQRLRAAVGEHGMVGRYGGDEFVVAGWRDTALVVADAVANASAAPFEVHVPERPANEPLEVFLSASVGIALGAQGDTAAVLLHHADAAMYRAKQRGRGGWELYDERMREHARSRLSLEADLVRALRGHVFELHHQPIIDLTDGAVVGTEALTRWSHPERGMVPPSEFIPVAEETGGIHELGAWAVETACAQASSWPDEDGTGELTVAVNLSPMQLERRETVSELAAVIDATGIQPGRLCLEITEGLLLDDPASAAAALRPLRALGVRIALDDFGTGWSSLTYLRTVPVDVVKIDRSFINGVGSVGEDDAVVGAIISMCHALGLKVVAEGVETPVQVEGLRRLGCDRVQGYLFAKPLPHDELRSWLATQGALGSA